MYKEDLTGKTFNKLTVLCKDRRYPTDFDYWLCECECGKVKSYSGKIISTGRIKSCGCIKTSKKRNKPLQNLSGQVFGEYTIQGLNSYTEKGVPIWDCICSCGEVEQLTTIQLNTRRYKCCEKCTIKAKLLNPHNNTPLGYKGISFNDKTQKYRTSFMGNRGQIRVGEFEDLHTAVQKRMDALKKYYNLK